MYDPTFTHQVTAAMHQDRVRALQRSRERRICARSTRVAVALALSRRLKRFVQATPVRTAAERVH